MVDYGVTNTGFVSKTYTDITTSMEDRLKHLFGEDIDLTPGSPIKVLTDLFSVELLKLWGELENTYKAGFVDSSSGDSLDSIGNLLGVVREDGTVSSGYVTFKRTTILPEGSTRIIPAGTIVSTADAYPLSYVTTATGYYAREIDDEVYAAQTSGFTEFDAENFVGGIVSITGSDLNDYTTNATYNGRTITLASEVPAGVSLTLDYYPLSITLPIQSSETGSITNANIGEISILTSALTFIHSVVNEAAVEGGSDYELDVVYRDRIKSTASAIGNSTKESIEYNLRNVTGVTNVIVDDFYIVDNTEIIAALTNDTSVTIDSMYLPLHSVTSITGATDGALTVTSIDDYTGEITFTPALTADQNVTVEYWYEDPTQLDGGSLGKIKIYVTGGTVGDANTEDTIVYMIETTRAAGIQSVGYNTDSPYAEGDSDSPFSWFYRFGEAIIDVTLTVTYDPDTELSTTQKTAIEDEITTTIESFINSLEVDDKIYENKILQLAIGSHTDILTATLDYFALNDVESGLDYLLGDSTEIPVAGTITIQNDDA